MLKRLMQGDKCRLEPDPACITCGGTGLTKYGYCPFCLKIRSNDETIHPDEVPTRRAGVTDPLLEG